LGGSAPIEQCFDVAEELVDLVALRHQPAALSPTNRGLLAKKEFRARVRIDTPNEVEYFRHGGILQFVLRQLRG
jgi:aconitase A